MTTAEVIGVMVSVLIVFFVHEYEIYKLQRQIDELKQQQKTTEDR